MGKKNLTDSTQLGHVLMSVCALARFCADQPLAVLKLRNDILNNLNQDKHSILFTVFSSISF